MLKKVIVRESFSKYLIFVDAYWVYVYQHLENNRNSSNSSYNDLQHIDRYHLINESLYTWFNSINWSGSSK